MSSACQLTEASPNSFLDATETGVEHAGSISVQLSAWKNLPDIVGHYILFPRKAGH